MLNEGLNGQLNLKAADSQKIAQQTFESRVDHYTGMAEAELHIIISHLREARALHWRSAALRWIFLQFALLKPLLYSENSLKGKMLKGYWRSEYSLKAFIKIFLTKGSAKIHRLWKLREVQQKAVSNNLANRDSGSTGISQKHRHTMRRKPYINNPVPRFSATAFAHTQPLLSAYSIIIRRKNICVRVWSLRRRIWWWWWRNMNCHLLMNFLKESSWICPMPPSTHRIVLTSSITQHIWWIHWVIASDVPIRVTARSVEFGNISLATWIEHPVTSRISLIFDPPFPFWWFDHGLKGRKEKEKMRKFHFRGASGVFGC